MYQPPFPISEYKFEYSSSFYYGVMKKGFVEWNHCRELFLDEMRNIPQKDRHGFFVVLSGTRRRISCFNNMIRLVQAMQDRLHLEPEQRLIVDTVEKCPHMRYIQLPEYWRTSMRIDFLSAFLRTAKNPERKTVQDVVNHGKYLMHTKPAVWRFLQGHTTLAKDALYFRGWMTYFRGKSAKEVRSILV